MTATRLFERAVIRLSPRNAEEDVVGFLQGLVTNDVAGRLPVYAGLLTPQGKTMFDFLVWPGSKGELLIDCEADAAEELAKRLSLYRLRRAIDIEVDPAVGVHWQREMGDGGAADPRLGALGQRWLSPVDDDDEAADDAWRAHRLSLGVPEGRAELGDILWLETNAVELHGVSFNKGCYVGQENTARMNWRSKVNRRLLVVPLESSEEKRRKVAHEDLELAVDHLRLGAIDTDRTPDWMKPGLTAAD
ncbi:folate-binding protein [Qipengyuania sp. XHP0211]|uniref:CAF17-like 4Fe-4S cluster assembly/insertion protein YgfZ n=1 Tax=Qipengyuania sp. XHP0211 TaxID=3038079 RepID=UPI00241DD5C2|nr:folate-binding protein [Qipengyuania sp. XHP0211]MDG5749755.1 folate-binding protein [Qipengyuania sp. XHP0211]